MSRLKTNDPKPIGGPATEGVSDRPARSDHVHPIDPSLLPAYDGYTKAEVDALIAAEAAARKAFDDSLKNSTGGGINAVIDAAEDRVAVFAGEQSLRGRPGFTATEERVTVPAITVTDQEGTTTRVVVADPDGVQTAVPEITWDGNELNVEGKVHADTLQADDQAGPTQRVVLAQADGVQRAEPRMVWEPEQPAVRVALTGMADFDFHRAAGPYSYYFAVATETSRTQQEAGEIQRAGAYIMVAGSWYCLFSSNGGETWLETYNTLPADNTKTFQLYDIIHITGSEFWGVGRASNFQACLVKFIDGVPTESRYLGSPLSSSASAIVKTAFGYVIAVGYTTYGNPHYLSFFGTQFTNFAPVGDPVATNDAIVENSGFLSADLASVITLSRSGSLVLYSGQTGAIVATRPLPSLSNGEWIRLVRHPETGVLLASYATSSDSRFVWSADDGLTWTTVPLADFAPDMRSWNTSAVQGGTFEIFNARTRFVVSPGANTLTRSWAPSYDDAPSNSHNFYDANWRLLLVTTNGAMHRTKNPIYTPRVPPWLRVSADTQVDELDIVALSDPEDMRGVVIVREDGRLSLNPGTKHNGERFIETSEVYPFTSEVRLKNGVTRYVWDVSSDDINVPYTDVVIEVEADFYVDGVLHSAEHTITIPPFTPTPAQTTYIWVNRASQTIQSGNQPGGLDTFPLGVILFIPAILVGDQSSIYLHAKLNLSEEITSTNPLRVSYPELEHTKWDAPILVRDVVPLPNSSGFTAVAVSGCRAMPVSAATLTALPLVPAGTQWVRDNTDASCAEYDPTTGEWGSTAIAVGDYFARWLCIDATFCGVLVSAQRTHATQAQAEAESAESLSFAWYPLGTPTPVIRLVYQKELTGPPTLVSVTTADPVPGQSGAVTPHATEHASDGTDPVTLSMSQIAGLPQVWSATKDPTGWEDYSAITQTYDAAARTVTMTQAGGVVYWWRGERKILTSPWTSPAHTNANGGYFLSTTDGTNFAWSTTPWAFSDAQTAYALKQTGYTFCIRETHGLMPYGVHESLHKNIGTYRESGGTLTAGTYALQPAAPADADNTPGIDLTVLADEDNKVTLPALAEGTYKILRLVGTVATFTDGTIPLRVTGTYPNINAGGAEVESSTGKYFNVWIYGIPVTGDAASQAFRWLWVQPQREHGSLAEAQGEAVSQVSLGDIGPLLPEFCPHAKITFRTSASYGSTGKCRIEAIEYLTTSRVGSSAAAPTPTASSVAFTPTGGIAATNVQTALAELDTEKAPLASPALTGNPTAPTPTAGDNDTSIATTAFVNAEIATDALVISNAGIAAHVALVDPHTQYALVAGDTFTGDVYFNQIIQCALDGGAPGANAARTRFGRSSGQYLTMHGSSSGNFLTSVSSAATPKPTMFLAVSLDDGATLDHSHALSGPSGDIHHSGKASLFPAGTAALPSVGIGGTDDGFSQPVTNTIALSIAGVARNNFRSDRFEANYNAAAIGSPGIPDVGSGSLNIYGAETGAPGLRVVAIAGLCELQFRKANGTAAAPTALVSGDDIFRIAVHGYGATGYSSRRAEILAEATQAWTDTANGTRWRFTTTANDTAAAIEGLRLEHTGQTLHADGTAALPSIGFIADVDNGLYRYASNIPAMSAGGVTRTLWTATELRQLGYATQPYFSMLRLNGTEAAPTAILAGEVLGEFRFGGQYGAVVGEYDLSVAGILAFAEADFSLANRSGYLAFLTTPSPGTNWGVRWRINHNGELVRGDYDSVLFQSAVTPALQVHGTTIAGHSAVGVARWSADGAQPRFQTAKSRGAAVGTFTAVQANDILGTYRFSGADGDQFIGAAEIEAIATGTIANDRVPGKLIFRTGTDAAPSVLTDALTIDSAQQVKAAASTDATSTTTGAITTPGGISAAKALWVGGLANIAGVVTAANTTDATTTSDGGTRVSGGLSVAKSLVTGNARKIAVRSVASAAGTTTLGGTDHFAVLTGSQIHTFTLPAASNGRVLVFKNLSASTLTISRAGSDTIDGGTSTTLATNQSCSLIANGTNWCIISRV